MLESSKGDAQVHRAEKDHSDYLKEQEEGWSIVSLYTIEDENGCSGEEVVRDETQDVETEAILHIEYKALSSALSHLDTESRKLIYALYLADTQKTERELALQSGVSQVAIHKQKKAEKENSREAKISGYQISKKFPIESERAKAPFVVP